MSWRQPPATTASAISPARMDAAGITGLSRNVGHSYRMKPFEEPARIVDLERGINGFDAQEKTVGRRARECRNVEHGMVRLRQAVQGPHADKAGQRRPQHGGLERHRNEL